MVAVAVVHHHNCSDLVRRKRNEVHAVSKQLEKKIEILENEIVDLRLAIEEVDEEINTLRA